MQESTARNLSRLETTLAIGVPIAYEVLLKTGRLVFSPEDFESYRPDLWMHRSLGYGLNKAGRWLYDKTTDFVYAKKDEGKEVYAAAAFATALGFAKEFVGVFDLDDVWANFEGSFAENVKSVVAKKRGLGLYSRK